MSKKLRDAKYVNYNTLRTGVKSLNESGLLDAKLKVTGIKKDALMNLFVTAVEDVGLKKGKENELPDEVVKSYNYLFTAPSEKEIKDGEKASKKAKGKAKGNGNGKKDGKPRKFAPSNWCIEFSKLIKKGGNKDTIAEKLAAAVGGTDTEAKFQTRTLFNVLAQLGFAEETENGTLKLVK